MDSHVFSIVQYKAAHIPETWVLLDSQSTVNLFSNPNLVTNIKNQWQYMNSRNTGAWTTNQMAEQPQDQPVWFNKDAGVNCSASGICNNGLILNTTVRMRIPSLYELKTQETLYVSSRNQTEVYSTWMWSQIMGQSC